MFCPNCGTPIHKDASFCAKCRKNISYITETAKKEELAEDEAKPTGKREDGFYCNACGSFVLPDDQYCYNCGKKLKKIYYTKAHPPQKGNERTGDDAEEEKSRRKYALLGLLLALVAIGTLIGYYLSIRVQ